MKFKLILIVTMVVSTLAQTFGETIFFNHLRSESGLSHHSVNAIYQDEQGIIWIGTRYGLNKYNGNQISVLKRNEKDKNTLFGNDIRYICGNQKGHIYILSNSVIVDYNLSSLEMTYISENNIVAIAYNQNRLWACNDSIVYSFDEKNKQLKEYARLNFKKRKISCIREARSGRLFIGTKGEGLYSLDKNKRLTQLIKNIEVVSPFEDSKQTIWVSTKQDGLFAVASNGRTMQLTNNPENKNSLPCNYIRAVCEDDFGNYWIGTFNGLCRYIPAQNKFTTFDHSEDKPYTIGSSSIWCIMKDRQGSIWLGSYYGGVDFFNPEYSFFNYYGVNNDKSSLSNPLVGRMTEDNNNNLWIGTEGGGVNCLNQTTGEVKRYKEISGSSGIHANNIKSFYFDSKNNVLWIGTLIEGLIRYNLKTKTSKTYQNSPANPLSLRNNYILDIECFDNKLYLATHNSVVVFDIATEKSYFLFDNKKHDMEERQVKDIMLDRGHNLWFSTSTAVFKYSIKTKELKKYRQTKTNRLNLRSPYQNVFFQDSKGRIWLGSGGSGLALYNPKTDNFKIFNSYNSGILDDYIIEIKETQSGYLVIATNKGFCFYDYEKNLFINFQNQSVFPFLSINEGGLYVAKNGEIYIGSTTGIFSFSENLLNIEPKSVNLVFTDLYINNNKVVPNENSFLKNDISYSESIQLRHNENAIAIEFSSTNYINGNQQEIEYMLVGFDKKWIKTNNRNIISYTNLNPGEYTLTVRAKLRNNIFDEKKLEIIIKPPFYASWYAYLFYTILIIIISYIIVKTYTSSIKLKVSLDYEKKEREQVEWLNQSKLRFFTNISHEFRTPLTLILNQIESTLQSTSIHSSIYSNMLSIHKNAQRMGRLINELLDFRKQEQGYVQLKVTEHNIVKFIEEIILTFKEYAEHRRISLTYNFSDPNINIWFDQSQMEKVIYNLFSNAFKFTPDGGEISADIQVDGIWVNIIIADNGSGIDSKDLNKIFDRFYQAENSYSQTTPGTGIGLALAKGIVELHHGKIISENKKEGGSRFIVSLLLNNDHFTSEQKLTNREMLARTEIEFKKPDEEFITEMINSQRKLSNNKYKILLIEDNQELLDMLSGIFGQIYEVETAVNGKEGLEKAINIQPDIIVSDVMMPEMSGIEMCSKLKSNLITSHIPIVLLTARTAIEYTIEGFRTGADDYITKPFDTRLLIARCNNLVITRKQLQAKFSEQPNVDITTVAINSLDQRFMTKALEVVEKYIDNPTFDINLFAQEMLMGRTTFYQKLKGITGQTPNEFVLNIRLKRSLQFLLDDPEMNMTDICYKLGFSSPSYFSKCFKDLFGMTPVKYRKEKLK